MSYNSDRPTTRPAKIGLLEKIKGHVTAIVFLWTTATGVIAGGYALYDRMTTDVELADHNVEPTAHAVAIRVLVDRIEALERKQKESEQLREDVLYLAERYVRLVASDGEPDRRKRSQAGEDAVQDFRALVRRGSTISDAAHQATRH